MAYEDKEGESYLDQLLNAVAPDWEDTSQKPEHPLMDEENDMSLDEALAILNDLPDSDDGEMVNDDMDADMGELFDLLSSQNDVSVPEAVQEIQQEESEFEVEPEEGAETEPEPEVQEEAAAFDMSDFTEGSVLGEFAMDEQTSEEDTTSQESVAVDDIFQDALSAVGYSENEGEEDIFSLDAMAEFMEDDPGAVSSIPVADLSDKTQEVVSDKPNFFQRIFGNIITEQTAEEEEREREAELEAKEKKAEAKEEKKKQAQLSKEEKEKLAEEAREKKKIRKAEKASQKAHFKEEKKRRKQEAEELAAREVVGKLNPVGTTIVVVFFLTIGVLTVFGSILINRASSLNDAENYYASGEFVKAYDAICAVELKEENQVLYDRIRICSKMQKEMNSYTNYTKMDMHLEALDSLMKGIRCYDTYKGEADALGAMSALNGLESQVAASLYNDYGLSETQARDILTIENQAEYTKRLQEIVRRVHAAEVEE